MPRRSTRATDVRIVLGTRRAALDKAFDGKLEAVLGELANAILEGR